RRRHTRSTRDWSSDVCSSDLVVVAAERGWELPATLTMPKGDGPFPAVVLVHGSGPHDRDESIGPNKPFRDLAGGLASRGIAVLRSEERRVGTEGSRRVWRRRG